MFDAELVILQDGQVGSFNALQKRLGRKKPSAKIQAELPASLVVYDVLEENGQDFAIAAARAAKTTTGKTQPSVLLSAVLNVSDWDEVEQLRQNARARRAEGVMIKRLDSPYRVGRKKGDWFKFKLDPLSLDVVLMYGQAGHGNRANLFSDYTLAFGKTINWCLWPRPTAA